MKIFLLLKSNHSATELTDRVAFCISIGFTGTMKLPTFGSCPRASVLDWCVWDPQVVSMAVGLWGVMKL